MRSPSLVTFDAYVALFDIESSLVPVVTETLSLNPEIATSFVRLWRAKQMERAAISNSLNGKRISFSDATALALDYAATKLSVKLAPTLRPMLIGAWNNLSPWPDANEVVSTMRTRGYPVAILSNGDQAMLEALAGQFSNGFDHVLSSETAGTYKPHPGVYDLPAQVLGVEKDKVLHVAGSANDVLGAAAAGMPCVWSNRHKDVLLDPAWPALAEFKNLRGLLDYCD